MSEQGHVERLRKQGKKLARANKKCVGKPNDKGQFYHCVSKACKEVFK